MQNENLRNTVHNNRRNNNDVRPSLFVLLLLFLNGSEAFENYSQSDFCKGSSLSIY